MKQWLNIMICLWLSAPLYAQVTKDKLDYIEKFKYIAIEEMVKNGIPASITLAQGILESNSGKSPLATEANNHFGIKCHKEWTGPGYYYDDDKKNECFRIYESAEGSYRDHSDFLKTRSRYAFLFELKEDDYESWAKGLKLAGYATNPKYAELLIKTIEDLELHRFDEKQTQRDVMKERELPLSGAKELNDKEKGGLHHYHQNIKEAADAQTGFKSEFNEYFVFNGIKTIKYSEGTLEEISEAYHVSVDLLREYNDLGTNEQPKPGEQFYLQPKRKLAQADFHTVKKGESMRDISQQHGIRLSKLLEKNQMTGLEQAAPGQILNLRYQRDSKPELIGYGEVARERINKPDADREAPKKEREDLISEEIPENYLVQSKETLYSIARRFGIPVSDIIKWNGLLSTDLKVGQSLRLRKPIEE